MAKQAKTNAGNEVKAAAMETAVVVEDALRSIASNIGDIFKAATEEGQNMAKTLGKDIQSSINQLAKSTSDLAKAQESANKGILTYNDVQKQIEGRNIKIQALKNQIEIAERAGVGNAKALKAELEQIEGYNQEYEASLKTQLDYSNKISKAMGLTGSLLSGAAKVARKLGLSGIDDVFERARGAAQKMAKSLVDSGKRAGSVGSKLKVLAAGFGGLIKGIWEKFKPEVLIGGLISGIKKAGGFIKNLITKGYEEGKTAAERISDENTGLARSLGLAQDAASKLAGSVAGMGPTVAASKASISGIYTAMGSTEKLTKSTLTTFVKLNTFAGVSAETLVKFQKTAKLSGQDAGKLAENLAKSSLEVIRSNKLSISQKELLKEQASITGIIKLRYSQQPEALLKVVALSKKIGMSMEQMKKSAEGLLNIEDSIANEMEAELLTGKELNFEEARKLALAGKTEEAAKMLVDQMGGMEEFNNMNVIQQEALAKTIGMSKDEMADMLMAQKENISANGDLTDGQQDGLKAMQSKVSLSEAQANIDRASEEASIKYYTQLLPLVQQLQKTWTEIKSIIAGLITEEIVKPFTDWFKSDAGQTFIKSLPEKARAMAKIIQEEWIPAIERGFKKTQEVIRSVTTFIKNNPWIASVAGLVGAGAATLIGKAISAWNATKGTSLNPMVVTMSTKGGLMSRLGGLISRLFNPTSGVPPVNPKTGKPFTRNSKAYKDWAQTQSTGGGGGGGGGGFFSKMGSKFANTSLGKGLTKVTSSVSNAASKAINFANPMTYIKKYMPKMMNSSGFKKMVGSIPKIGKIASLAMIAHDLYSNGAGVAEAAKAGASPQDIGKMVVMALGDLGGSIIGGALGSLIPVPGVGTMLGTFLGGLGGSKLAEIIANNSDVSGIGDWMIKNFGKGGDKAEDFILQDGKMTKFRKDDVIIGGTNLGGGDPKVAQLLERLVIAVERGGTVTLDGQKVGQMLALGAYKQQ